jgi:hypothetical protein
LYLILIDFPEIITGARQDEKILQYCLQLDFREAPAHEHSYEASAKLMPFQRKIIQSFISEFYDGCLTEAELKLDNRLEADIIPRKPSLH